MKKSNIKLTIADIISEYGVTKDQILDAAKVFNYKLNGGFTIEQVEQIISVIDKLEPKAETVEPEQEKPKFSYPMWFKNIHDDTIVEFIGLTSGYLRVKGKKSFNKVGDYISTWRAHTDTVFWEQIDEPKLEPKKDICNSCKLDFKGCDNPKYGKDTITECDSFCPVKPDIKQDLTTEPLATEEEEQKVFDEVIKHPIVTPEEIDELLAEDDEELSFEPLNMEELLNLLDGYSKGDLWYNEAVGVVQIVELMQAENPKGGDNNISLVWYEPRGADADFMPMATPKELFEISYKPYEVVYEYKYAVDTEFGETITEQRFKDDDEMLSKVRAVKNFQRLDYTKRERNAQRAK